MKKTITLMAAIFLVASSFAQHADNSRIYQDREVTYNDNRFENRHDRRDDRYNFSIRERDNLIAKINHEYDRKIESVRHRWFMSHSKKQSIIWSLEDKRRYEIKKVYERFNHHRNHFDDHSKNRW